MLMRAVCSAGTVVPVNPAAVAAFAGSSRSEDGAIEASIQDGYMMVSCSMCTLGSSSSSYDYMPASSRDIWLP